MDESFVDVDAGDTDVPEPEVVADASTEYVDETTVTERAPEDIDAMHEREADAIAHVVEGDDSVIVPAAPTEYLGHAPVVPYRRKLHVPQGKSLGARRTLIPILLTTGVMMIVAGTLKFVVGEDSPLRDAPLWMPMVAYVVALVLLVVAVLNMLMVRQEMKPQVNEPAQ